MAVTRTFSIIKPDATRRNLTEKINARFEDAGLPVIGDDIKSQVGATIVHRQLARHHRQQRVLDPAPARHRQCPRRQRRCHSG